MVNDFPKLSLFTSDAFFADDCTIWRSGNNIIQITYHLQQDLDVISAWCKKWGFIINTGKTTGIIFSKGNVNPNSIKLIIDNKPIVFNKTCKVLGINFDNHLTWKTHIDYIIDKSSKGLNIMRCISGTSWGSNKDTLITIYRSLILSQLDYCCFIYDKVSHTNSNRLDTIQYKALLLATGAMRGTSLNALLGECSELPLNYRRKQLTINYLLKIDNNLQNSAHKVLSDKKFFQFQLNCKSKFKVILRDFLSATGITLSPICITYSYKPWGKENKYVDLSFLDMQLKTDVGNNSDVADLINNSIEDTTTVFENLLFVDGSVSSSGGVGASVHSPLQNINNLFKLPDHLTVYYAEAYAILQAITTAVKTNLKSFCIISDNFKVLKDIKHEYVATSPHPSIILSILNQISIIPHNNFLLKWMPSNCRHPSIVNSDRLAKSASSSSTIQQISFTKYEVSAITEAWVWKDWRKKWQLHPNGSYQNTFKPACYIPATNKNRRYDIIKNRFRLLQTKLNSGLYKVGLHDSGLCEECGVEETAFHFLFDCTKNVCLRNSIKRTVNIPLNPSKYQELVSNQKVIDILINYITANNISI